MEEAVFASMSKAEQVAQLLLNQIIKADLKPGTSFGTEADLLQKYRVSRPTLRESLRILESQGVLSLRPGPGGGIIVNKPSIDFLAHALSVYLRLNDVPFIAVVHAREAIEPALAREAALKGTDEDFKEMAASIARMEAIKKDQTAFIEENRVFHSVIARAAANPVLAAFWSTISILASGESHGVRYSARNQAHVVAAHGRILEACEKRDGETAAKVMAEHVQELEALLRARYRELLDEPTRIASRPSRKVI